MLSSSSRKPQHRFHRRAVTPVCYTCSAVGQTCLCLTQARYWFLLPLLPVSWVSACRRMKLKRNYHFVQYHDHAKDTPAASPAHTATPDRLLSGAPPFSHVAFAGCHVMSVTLLLPSAGNCCWLLNSWIVRRALLCCLVCKAWLHDRKAAAALRHERMMPWTMVHGFSLYATCKLAAAPWTVHAL